MAPNLALDASDGAHPSEITLDRQMTMKLAISQPPEAF
jgi:hypothetical protein